MSPPLDIQTAVLCTNENRKLQVDSNGKTYVVLGSGNSSDLGKEGEEALVRWVEEMYVRGWPVEWGDVHAAAKSIARSQGENLCTYLFLFIIN